MTAPFCRHTASALLPWYLNRALRADQHEMVRDHVEGCDVCAVELQDLEAVVRGAALPAHQASQPVTNVASRGRSWVLPLLLALPLILGLLWVLVGVARGRW